MEQAGLESSADRDDPFIVLFITFIFPVLIKQNPKWMLFKWCQTHHSQMMILFMNAEGTHSPALDKNTKM